ncbi:MAG: methyl-accepting chemotaxis protein, partial [Proteocatella sp.]
MKFKSIKTRILSIVLVILFLSLGTVSAIFSILSIKNTQDTLYKVMEETAGTAALAIENRLLATRSAISEIGTTAALSNPKIPLAEKNKILDSKKEKYKLMSMDVADKSGKTLNSDSIAGTEGFEVAMGGDTYISSPILDGSKQVIIVTAPLWKNGIYGTEIVGAVYAQLDSMFLSGITEQINIGETGVALILNEEGTTIAFKDEKVVAQQENMIEASKTDPKLETLAEIEKKALTGEPSYGEYFYGKTKYLGLFSPIGGTKWVMGISVQKIEFMKQIYVTTLACIAISAAFFAVAALIIIRFTVKITEPIKEIEEAAKRMCEGDYDVVVTHHSEDELGNLAESIRTMTTFTKDIIEDASRGLEKLSEGYFDLHRDREYPGVFKPIEDSILNIALSLSQTLGNIKVSAEQVNSGSEQVSATAQSLAEGASEQASSVEELSAAINEISDKIQKNAENAQKVNDITSGVGHELENSNKKMHMMMRAIEDISDKSVEINKIIKVIEDIAFQTNILALNA